MKLDFLKYSESINFVTIQSVFLNICYKALYESLPSVLTSKNISDQDSSKF